MVEGPWVKEGLGEGMERFGRYFGRKGWFGFERVDGAEVVEGDGEGAGGREVGDGNRGNIGETGKKGVIEETETKWHVGEKSGRILVEVATAYAITKVLLPARILVSVWATPWFARVFWGLYRRGLGGAAAAGSYMGKAGQEMKKMP